MQNIYVIGDIHTVSAFRLAGAKGIVSDTADAKARLDEVINKKNAGLVLITNELVCGLEEQIARMNLDLPDTVILEIPGIDDSPEFRKSTMRYVSEALGISM